MSVPFKIQVGDLQPSLQHVLVDQNGDAKNLTDHTVALKWKLEGDTTEESRVADVISPATSGVVQYDWDTPDTAVAGLYNAQWVATSVTSLPGTFPTVNFFQFLLWEQLSALGQHDIVWPDIVNLDSILGNVDPGAQLRILEYANVALKVSEFDGEGSPKIRLARMYLAAHHGTLSIRGGSKAGPVTGQTVGPISRSYGSMTSGDSLYNSTTWGQAFLQLVRTSPARLPCVP